MLTTTSTMLCKAFVRDISTTSRQNNIVASWKNKIIVNDLKLPKFMNIHGPTGEEILKDMDLTGKTCLITGGTSGIGLEMSQCLLRNNCNLLMASRNTYAANMAGKGFCRENSLRTYEMNLASLTSVKKCSENLLNDQKKIDILILNAGVFGIPWTLTEDGLETIFQVNYLSHFYLLLSIEKILAPNVRVVFVSSESHRNVNWNFQQTLSPREELLSVPYDEYTSIKAYNISKLCGLLAMRYLGYRWLNTGKSVFCAHPGSFVKTNLCSNWLVYEALYSAFQPFTKSIGQAAATPLYCATSPDLKGLSCIYYKDCKETEPSEIAQDSFISYRLYELSQSIIRDRLRATEIIEKEKETDPIDVKETQQDRTGEARKPQVEETIAL